VNRFVKKTVEQYLDLISEKVEAIVIDAITKAGEAQTTVIEFTSDLAAELSDYLEDQIKSFNIPDELVELGIQALIALINGDLDDFLKHMGLQLTEQIIYQLVQYLDNKYDIQSVISMGIRQIAEEYFEAKEDAVRTVSDMVRTVKEHAEDLVEIVDEQIRYRID